MKGTNLSVVRTGSVADGQCNMGILIRIRGLAGVNGSVCQLSLAPHTGDVNRGTSEATGVNVDEDKGKVADIRTQPQSFSHSAYNHAPSHFDASLLPYQWKGYVHIRAKCEYMISPSKRAKGLPRLAVHRLGHRLLLDRNISRFAPRMRTDAATQCMIR